MVLALVSELLVHKTYACAAGAGALLAPAVTTAAVAAGAVLALALVVLALVLVGVALLVVGLVAAVIVTLVTVVTALIITALVITSALLVTTAAAAVAAVVAAATAVVVALARAPRRDVTVLATSEAETLRDPASLLLLSHPIDLHTIDVHSIGVLVLLGAAVVVAITAAAVALELTTVYLALQINGELLCQLDPASPVVTFRLVNLDDKHVAEALRKLIFKLPDLGSLIPLADVGEVCELGEEIREYGVLVFLNKVSKPVFYVGDDVIRCILLR